MIYAEVLDSIEHTKEFIKLNKIKKKEIREIIIVWREDDN